MIHIQTAIDLQDPVTLLAAAFALVATLALTHPATKYLGRDTRLWRVVRNLLPYVDPAAKARGFYVAGEIGTGQTAGVLECRIDDAVELLRDEGFMLSPLASHKSLEDGRHEVASLAKFGDRNPAEMTWPFSTLYLLTYPKQLHVTLFEARSGDVNSEFEHPAVLVTAHKERSAYNPLTAWWHFRAKNFDIEEGVSRAASILKDDERYVPSAKAVELLVRE